MDRLLVDNDVLLKLAHWGLLDELTAVFGLGWSEISAPHSLMHRAARADRKIFRNPGAAADLARRLVQCRPLSAFDHGTTVEAMQDVNGLDAGEILLIAELAHDPTAVLVTGDKRALKALEDPKLIFIRPVIAGRIVCLEQLLLRLVDLYGVDAVVAATDRDRDADIAVRCAAGTRRPPVGAEFQEGLRSYIKEISDASPSLLASHI
jgi:hypothetical protein